MYDLAHVAAWESYNVHNLGQVSLVEAVLQDPAQDLITAG